MKNINSIQIIGDNVYLKGNKVATLETTASTAMDEFKEHLNGESQSHQQSYDDGYQAGKEDGYDSGFEVGRTDV